MLHITLLIVVGIIASVSAQLNTVKIFSDAFMKCLDVKLVEEMTLHLFVNLLLNK